MIVKSAYNWQKMAGDSALEKMINAFLTTQFVLGNYPLTTSKR